MLVLLSMLLAAHAIAHLPGFLVSWHLLREPELPYKTTILGGRVDVGTVGIRVIGVLWLVAAVGIGSAAVHVFRNTGSWWPITLSAVGFSALMTILGWPDSRTGVVLNAVVIAFLVWVATAGS